MFCCPASRYYRAKKTQLDTQLILSICRQPHHVSGEVPIQPRQQTYLLTSFLTYLLTPWCRVLLQKLTGLQLVKKFPAFHRTRRFITALTSVRHLSLSWASPIQSIYPHPISRRSVLILSTHLRLGLPSGLFPSGFPTKTLFAPSPYPYSPHAQPISFFAILSPAQYWARSTNHLAPRYAISSIPPLPRPSSRTTDSHLKRLINTNCCIHTVVPPDDGPRYTRNM